MDKLFKIRFLLGTAFQAIKTVLLGPRKPRTLQLPITGFCNSKCVTCNVWKNTHKAHINAPKLREALADPFFCDIESVGINGGEFTLVPNLSEVIESVLTLPKLKSVWLISNCLMPQALLEKLRGIKSQCERKRVRVGLTISLDGVGAIDNMIRGVPQAFDQASYVLNELNENKAIYCNYCDVGCTISKYNAPYLQELECYMTKYKNINVYYHLAVPNKRIGTFNDSDYSVLCDDRARMLTAEFFFSQYHRETKSFARKLQMWANYYYLNDIHHMRPTLCSWYKQDVTIDEHLNLYLCATASELIGSLNDSTATELMRSGATKHVRKDLKRHCRNCIHYSYSLSLRGLIAFCQYFIKEELFRGRHYTGK